MRTLFDYQQSQAVRASDPDTSRDAVPTISARNEWQRRCMWAIVELERHGGVGATVHEIAMRLAYLGQRVPAENALSRRLTDLHRGGFVVDRGVRRPGGAGRDQIAWGSTALGREALDG